MDPVTAITTVANIALAIKKWLDDTAEKSEAIVAIGSTINRLSNVLDLLATKARVGEIDSIITPEIDYLGSILTKTLQDVRVWTPRGLNVKKIVATLTPAKVVEVIREDERKIMEQLIMLMFALSARSYVNDRVHVPDEPNALKWIRNPEVADFWSVFVGSKIFFVPTIDFKAALRRWYTKPLDDSVCNDIIFRLDEFAIGGVNVTALDDFAGTKSLRLIIAAYAYQTSNAEKIIPKTSSSSPIASPKLPLLVWVDDNPNYNEDQIQMAKALGIEVVTLFTTGEAKMWIDMHLEFLLQNDEPNSIRFITDNARVEHVQDRLALNPNAGADILRYIRGRRLDQIPVLVFTASSIPYTTYVKDFNLAGSTVNEWVVEEYIKGLAEKRVDSEVWGKFHA